MRALGRVGWLLAAGAVPLCVVALGVGIQAAAFNRPPPDALLATDAVRELLRFHVMRATEVFGAHRIRASCVQGWFRPAHHRRPEPGALVLLGNGVKLYDFSKGIRRVGRRGTPSKRDLAHFLLAGCPRYIGDRVGNQLVNSNWVDADPSHADSSPTLELSFGRANMRMQLFVDRVTYRPLALRLTGSPTQGWSDLNAGGGATVVTRVRRAFHLPVRPSHHA